MTYIYISIPFLLCAVALWLYRLRAYPRQVAVTLAVTTILVVLTIVFDNLMVAAGLVGYQDVHNSGLYIGLIPIEDLFYTIFVALIVCAFWPKAKS